MSNADTDLHDAPRNLWPLFGDSDKNGKSTPNIHDFDVMLTYILCKMMNTARDQAASIMEYIALKHIRDRNLLKALRGFV